MFDKSARFYDAIYAKQYDLPAKAAWVLDLLRERGQPAGRLLDAACGTGAFIPFLRPHYDIVGLDLDPGMLAIARARCPDVTFHQADFTEFDLGEQFDVVLCLGSSIGYARTVDGLRRTIATFARHTLPGGLVVVEPWLRPEVWTPGYVSALFVDEPDLKIARMGVSGPAVDRLSILDWQYLVATPAGIEAFTEHHELGLFTDEEHLTAEAIERDLLAGDARHLEVMDRGHVAMVPAARDARAAEPAGTRWSTTEATGFTLGRWA